MLVENLVEQVRELLQGLVDGTLHHALQEEVELGMNRELCFALGFRKGLQFEHQEESEGRVDSIEPEAGVGYALSDLELDGSYRRHLEGDAILVCGKRLGLIGWHELFVLL